MSYKDPHNHSRVPVSREEREDAGRKGLVWDPGLVAFREPVTSDSQIVGVTPMAVAEPEERPKGRR